MSSRRGVSFALVILTAPWIDGRDEVLKSRELLRNPRARTLLSGWPPTRNSHQNICETQLSTTGLVARPRIPFATKIQ